MSFEAVRADIKSFKESEAYRFAPDTIERGEAYLGAAMLAADQQNDDDVIRALEKADEKLQEARQTASNFRQQYQDLLSLRLDAIAVVKIHSPAALAEKQPTFQSQTQ